MFCSKSALLGCFLLMWYQNSSLLYTWKNPSAAPLPFCLRKSSQTGAPCIFQSHFSVTCEAAFHHNHLIYRKFLIKIISWERETCSWWVQGVTDTLPTHSIWASANFLSSPQLLKEGILLELCHYEGARLWHNSFIPKMTAFQINPPLNFNFDRTRKHSQENKHAQPPPLPLSDTLLSTRERNFSTMNPGLVIADLF